LIELADSTTGGPPAHNDGPSDVLILPLYSILSATEQAKVFNPAPENTRLIVIATNVAETSITIPDIKYVIDAGRQKCRNYHPVTGMASYDIMWISQASADQRAGRAGRTGPGHCYRLYSASVYTRQFDPFTLPEVLVRPLEDVILMMKAMKITRIHDFPFPTPPDSSQLQAATKLLANIGCIDLSRIQIEGGDGIITKLGEAVSKLPIGVRYGKMLIAASEAEVLDFGITIVAILSESCPFVRHGEETLDSDSDDSSSNDSESGTNTAVIRGKNRWGYKGGDLLSALHAAGAYSYALRGGKGSESLVNRFCEENGLHPVVMQRIQRMRLHLAQLVRTRFVKTESVAAKTGGILSTKPPTKHEEKLLQQVGILLCANE
jgi:ATP-dependent RNA helicase DHX37/DHR1